MIFDIEIMKKELVSERRQMIPSNSPYFSQKEAQISVFFIFSELSNFDSGDHYFEKKEKSTLFRHLLMLNRRKIMYSL